MSAAADSRIYRDRWWAHVQRELCLSGCGRKALRIGNRILSYCRRCGAVRVLGQRARLGQQPRSASVPGRASVYLPAELR